MIRTTVTTVDRFPKLTELVEEKVAAAVQHAAEAGAAVAVNAGSPRNLTDVQVQPVHGYEDGYVAGIAGPFYYRYHSYGTLGRALRAKRPGTKRSHAPGTGITPNMMWQMARTAARRALNQQLRRIL